MSSDIGERIRELRLKNSLTMDELAKRVGYNSRASVSRMEHGETDLPLSKVNEFAKALNTTPAYLMGWTEDPEEEEYDYDLDPEGRLDGMGGAIWDHFINSYPTVTEAYKHYREFEKARDADMQKEASLALSLARPIPILGEICCGDGLFTEESFSGYFYIDNSVHADYCLRARGDSMTDAGINAGDLVLIEKTTDFEQGKIYAIHREGEQLVSLKKVFKNDDTHLMLVPCNPEYSPEQVSIQDVSLIGKRTCVCKKI